MAKTSKEKRLKKKNGPLPIQKYIVYLHSEKKAYIVDKATITA